MISLFHSLCRHRDLLVQMIRREIKGRFSGSMLGMLWPLLTPMLMMAIYGFVFTVIFPSRWPGVNDGAHPMQYALLFFSGFMVYLLFAECIGRAPTLILHNENFVKKVIFPLELYPVITLASALFHQMFYVALLLLARAWLMDGIPVSALWLPVIWLPLCLVILGLGWFLASLGVYLRDVGQVIQLLLTMLLFLSPVFYPKEALPEYLHRVIDLNPLTVIIEQTRRVMIDGLAPDLHALLIYGAVSLVVAILGLKWFEKTRKGFADVL